MAGKVERKADRAEVTRVQFDTALGVYSSNAKQLTELADSMEKELAAIRAKYTPQIENLTLVRDSQFETIKNFVLPNQDFLFTQKKRSVTVGDLVYGLRKDTASVKTIGGKSWEEVIDILKQKKPELLRTIEVIDKEKILDKRTELAGELAGLSLKISQEDKFFIQPAKPQADKEVKIKDPKPEFPSTKEA